MSQSKGTYVWKVPQGTSVAVGQNTGPLDSSWLKSATLNVNISAIVGGTAPTFQFFVDRQGGDEIWYEAASTPLITAVGNVSLDLVDAIADGTDIQHFVFTDFLRVRLVFGGTVVATSVTFSGSLYGRSQ